MERCQTTLLVDPTTQLLGNKEWQHFSVLDGCLEPTTKAQRHLSTASLPRVGGATKGIRPTTMDSGDKTGVQTMEADRQAD